MGRSFFKVMKQAKSEIYKEYVDFENIIDNKFPDKKKIECFASVNELENTIIYRKFNNNNKNSTIKSLIFHFKEYQEYNLELPEKLSELFDIFNNKNNIKSLNNSIREKIFQDYYSYTVRQDNKKIVFETGPFVGRLYLGLWEEKNIECFIQINPKVGNAAVLNMFNISNNTNIHIDSENGEMPASENLSNLYFIMYLQKLEEFSMKYFKRDYIQKSENLNKVKGRINLKKQINNIIKNQPYKIHCNYFELSNDVLINRILKFAFNIIKKYSDNDSKIISAMIKNRIAKLLPLLTHISDTNISISEISSINLSNSKNKKYREIFPIAVNIIKSISADLNTNHEEILSFGFLINMNKLFEDFVYSKIKKHCSKTLLVFSDNIANEKYDEKYLFENNKNKNFKLKPDIILKNLVKDDQNPDTELLICDAKYKILNDIEKENFGISNPDMYQMFAYLHIYKAKKGILIYPKIPELNLKTKTFKIDEKIIKIVFMKTDK